MYSFFLMAAPPDGGAAASGGAASMFMSFVPFILIIGIFYFLIIRPQNKKQKETEKMLAALKKGDKVVTIGGVHGYITNVKDNSVVVKVDDTSKIEFSRSAIASVTAAENVKVESKTEKVEDNTNKENE
ncbi:MAG: preprotein translocase subunit YajC [Spirochaetaceae bacterium]|jgi:preprotein translocase subunit YajC|nr:preprotein translocase subunit YajC [Spirochaetaceae bacterium]